MIAEAPIRRYVPGNKTVVIGDDNYEVVLALTRFWNRETWVLSGWKIEKEAGEASEVSTQSSPTQTNPTFSREDLGAALSARKDTNSSENSYTPMRISAQQDAEYMAAVNSGDMEKARRMVDEAAACRLLDTCMPLSTIDNSILLEKLSRAGSLAHIFRLVTRF